MAQVKYSYGELRRRLCDRFRRHGVFDADRAAWELLCAASGKTHSELVREAEQHPSAEALHAVDERVERLERGEPLAYVLGEWDFYGMTLEITPSVLIPRPDTETLAEQAIKAARQRKPCRVLDLCAGSGCVGLSIAENVPDAEVVFGELDPDALEVCRRNALRFAPSSYRVICLDALRTPPNALGQFDIIVCNPPYISDISALDSSVRDYEPHIALDGGHDGLMFYQAISSHWRSALKAKATLLFEVGIGQADAVRQMLHTNGFAEIAVIPDLAGVERVVAGIWR